jgi:hypothetical protein
VGFETNKISFRVKLLVSSQDDYSDRWKRRFTALNLALIHHFVLRAVFFARNQPSFFPLVLYISGMTNYSDVLTPFLYRLQRCYLQPGICINFLNNLMSAHIKKKVRLRIFNFRCFNNKCL